MDRLYFHSGQARATVFIGNAAARTFDFTAGDTAVFPDNSGACMAIDNLRVLLTWYTGHYIENTSDTEDLIWIEIYKADRVADIPLTQWLGLTPADIVANTLKIPLDVAKNLKKEKQVLIKGQWVRRGTRFQLYYS
jgi:oxalate decarboxylase